MRLVRDEEKARANKHRPYQKGHGIGDETEAPQQSV